MHLVAAIRVGHEMAQGPRLPRSIAARGRGLTTETRRRRDGEPRNTPKAPNRSEWPTEGTEATERRGKASRPSVFSVCSVGHFCGWPRWGRRSRNRLRRDGFWHSPRRALLRRAYGGYTAAAPSISPALRLLRLFAAIRVGHEKAQGPRSPRSIAARSRGITTKTRRQRDGEPRNTPKARNRSEWPTEGTETTERRRKASRPSVFSVCSVGHFCGWPRWGRRSRNRLRRY
jgi:hypothetical protein